MKDAKTYSLNSVLVICNYLLCLVGTVLYYQFGPNQYADANTLVLLYLFGVQNHFFLAKRKSTDPFFLILVPIIMIFYMGRVVTLFYDPQSTIFENSVYVRPDDVNKAIIFILIANASIFLGLNLPKRGIMYRSNTHPRQEPAHYFNVVGILAVTLLIDHLCNLLQIQFLSTLRNYLAIFIDSQMFLLLTFLYVAVNGERLSNKNKLVIYCLIATDIILITLSGDRSALLICASLLLIVLASVKNEIRVKKKIIMISAILVPCSIVLFIFATMIRVNVIHRNEIVSDLKEVDLSSDINRMYIPNLFNRMAFLDFTTDLIKNEAQYNKVIDMAYYVRSIIDRGLTPGFDIWDTVRSAQALRYIYSGDLIVPTPEDLLAVPPHADMFTLYGEYYVLFGGFFAILVIFICAYLFKIAYLSIQDDDIFIFYLYRSLILYVFYVWLNSFGMDWLAIQLIGIFTTIFLFGRFYKMRPLNA